MIEFQKAHALVLENCKTLGTEKVKIEDATGRILAENVCSDADIPPFDRSAMDGYAVRSSDVAKTPAILKIISQIKAGTFSKKTVTSGTAAAIMTGAPIPPGADAVVMVEDTKKTGKDSVKVNALVKKKKNIRKKGEDVKKNSIVLKYGSRIGASEVSVAAVVGKESLKVFKMPRVAVLATGDELLHHSRVIKKGQIRNSNSPMLISMVRSLGLKVDYLGIAKDNIEDLRQKIKKGLTSDILILSGGVSMGEYDLVPEVFKSCRVKNIFHKVAVKPGKPVFFGKKGNTLIFGAPGNPVSVLTTFLLFIKPAIRKICGIKDAAEPFKGVLSEGFSKRGKRRAYYPVKIAFKNDKYMIQPIKYHGSAHISALTEADGFMMAEQHNKYIKKGEKVEFILL